MNKYVIPVLFFMMLSITSVCYFIVPDNETSVDENRTLTSMPEFNTETLFSGKYTADINSYMSDQFPFRNTFIKIGDKINSVMHFESEYKIQVNNGNAIIIDNSRAVDFYSLEYEDLYNYASTLNTYAVTLANVNVFSMIVPTASEFYLDEKFTHSNVRYSQENAVDTLYSLTVPGVIKINAFDKLKAASSIEDNYVYYRTDHHWTGKGAYEGYTAFCEAANLTPVPLEKFTPKIVPGDFVGSFYRFTKDDSLLGMPDTVEYYVPSDVIWEVTTYLDPEMTNFYDTDLFVEPPLEEPNKYITFLNGDHPIVRITTENVYSGEGDGRNLLIIKDSYGNALAPYMVYHYKNIYILDPRYTTPNLEEFCKTNKINDLIVESYALSLSNSEASEMLDTLIVK